MQKLKEEVKARILTSAETEFLNMGYQKASMRRIATSAEISPGNIYAYFDGKDALFEAVVAPAVYELSRLLRLEKNRFALRIQALTDEITHVFLENRKSFLILITGSEGSRYNHFRDHITAAAAKRIEEEHLSEMFSGEKNPLFARSLAEALVAGVLYLMLHDSGEEGELRRNLRHLVTLMLAKSPEIGHNKEE